MAVAAAAAGVLGPVADGADVGAPAAAAGGRRAAHRAAAVVHSLVAGKEGWEKVGEGYSLGLLYHKWTT